MRRWFLSYNSQDLALRNHCTALPQRAPAVAIAR